SFACARCFTCRSAPPTDAAMTKSFGAGPFSCNVQSAVEMWDATASSGCPGTSVQLQVMGVGAEGWGRLRSRLPGDRMCTSLHPVMPPEVNQAAMLLSFAIATFGPPVLLGGVWEAGRPATAEPASRSNPAVASKNRMGRRYLRPVRTLSTLLVTLLFLTE